MFLPEKFPPEKMTGRLRSREGGRRQRRRGCLFSGYPSCCRIHLLFCFQTSPLGPAAGLAVRSPLSPSCVTKRSNYLATVCDKGNGLWAHDQLDDQGGEESLLTPHFRFDFPTHVVCRHGRYDFLATTQQLMGDVAGGTLPDAVTTEPPLPRIGLRAVSEEHVNVAQK